MSHRLPIYPTLTLGMLALAACGETTTPTPADMAGNPTAALALTAAPNTWTPKAAPPFDQYIYGYDLGMAPNSAGESIVYAFGGTSSDDGFTGNPVKAYNVATNTWTGRQSIAHIFYSNGVVKIGNKLYFSGGYINAGNLPDATHELWAYDYSNDRMIRKAPLPSSALKASVVSSMASSTCSPARVTGTATPVRDTVSRSKLAASTAMIRSAIPG